MQKADRIVILKSERRLELYRGEEILRDYKISLGRAPEGDKGEEGDNKTPEGKYVIDHRNPNSKYHRSLRISYPSVEDKKRAAAQGVNPGGDIMIHGLPNQWGWLGGLHRTLDWTRGCIAVTNKEIEEIWELVPDGTPVEIKP